MAWVLNFSECKFFSSSLNFSLQLKQRGYNMYNSASDFVYISKMSGAKDSTMCLAQMRMLSTRDCMA